MYLASDPAGIVPIAVEMPELCRALDRAVSGDEPDTARERSPGGNARSRFIVGAPRSGTTLLRVTLTRHSQLAVSGETHYFARVYARRHSFGDPANPRNRERIVAAYSATEPVRRMGMDGAFLRERLMSEGVSWRALFGASSGLCRFPRQAVRRRKDASARPRRRNPLRLVSRLQHIHLIRDPRAAVCSLTQMPWASRSVLVGARRWRLLNAGACMASSRDNYLLVKYEDLVAQPEQQLRRLCNHIGIEYQSALLEPDPAELDQRRPHHRSYEKMTPARVALWRAQLEPWQVSAIEAVAGNYMEEFGYERQTTDASAGLARARLDALAETTCQAFLRAPLAFCRFLKPTNLAGQEKWFKRASKIYERVRLRPDAEIQRSSDGSK